MTDNIETAINNKKSVTMRFLPGIHYADSNNARQINFTVPVIKMIANVIALTDIQYSISIAFNYGIGISSGTTLTYDHVSIVGLTLNSPAEHMNNLPSASLQILSTHMTAGIITMNNSTIYGENFEIVGIFIDVSSSRVTFSNGTLDHTVSRLESVDLTLYDCKVAYSAIIVLKSSVAFSGITVYKNGFGVISYSTDITVSGKLTFSNNNYLRGGAMSLYSSNLRIASGTNMIFKNNSASHKGGAVYIEPDLSLGIWISREPRCFYYPLNCNDDADANYNIFLKTT